MKRCVIFDHPNGCGCSDDLNKEAVSNSALSDGLSVVVNRWQDKVAELEKRKSECDGVPSRQYAILVDRIETYLICIGDLEREKRPYNEKVKQRR